MESIYVSYLAERRDKSCLSAVFWFVFPSQFDSKNLVVLNDVLGQAEYGRPHCVHRDSAAK